jgi:hypothetical protein
MQQGLNATWELLQSGATNDQQLAAMQDIWARGAIVPDLALCDQAYNANRLDNIEATTWGMTNDDAAWVPLRHLPPTIAFFWCLAGRYFDEYAVLLMSHEQLRITRDLAKSRRWTSEHGEHWPKSVYWCLPWIEVMPGAGRLGGNFLHYMLRTFEFETQREMTITAIALQRFRLHHGQYPERLNDLIPEFLAEPPRDWMDGQPLRYRRNPNDTFTLYSVGEDLRDDGGDLTTLSEWVTDPEPMFITRDAVWPMLATKETVAALKRDAAAKKQRPWEWR